MPYEPTRWLPDPMSPVSLPARGSMSLYVHKPHPHVPRDTNEAHRQEMASSSFNTRLAVWLTQHVGSMLCAYAFAGIGIGSLVGVFTGNALLAGVFGSLSSYFLQLVLLPILSVGANVLGRRQELQSDEMFRTSQRSFHDIEGIMHHLEAQDGELLRQTRMLERLEEGKVTKA